MRSFPLKTAALVAVALLFSCQAPVLMPTATYSVVYDKNGADSGAVPVDTTLYENGQTVTVRGNSGALALDGYDFAGWNTARAGTGTDRVPGSTFAMGQASVYLFAQWDPSDPEDPPSGTFTENLSLPQAVRDYYRPAYGLSGAELKSAIQGIITNSHDPGTYTGLWTMFASSDVAPNGKVWDMYSNTSADGSTAAYWFTLVEDQAGNYSTEGDVYNREHSWPKSTFGDAEPGYSDGHHICATDGYVNGRRSNYAYGEVDSASWTSQNGSLLGLARSGLGYTGTVFEPIDAYKGDLARMHFYMAVRYYGSSDFLDCAWSKPGAKLKTWYDDMLRAWAAADPVSDKERVRNNAVQAHQDNRNPFIDYPELLDLLDLEN
ncbi:MAG: endonuclease [Spirochaetales bacterium]|nr:endonuclease [Spirochaetales bacterium]